MMTPLSTPEGTSKGSDFGICRCAASLRLSPHWPELEALGHLGAGRLADKTLGGSRRPAHPTSIGREPGWGGTHGISRTNRQPSCFTGMKTAKRTSDADGTGWPSPAWGSYLTYWKALVCDPDPYTWGETTRRVPEPRTCAREPSTTRGVA